MMSMLATIVSVPTLSIPSFSTLAAEENDLKMVVIVGGLGLAALIMVLTAARKVTEVRQREQTRREVAAYVAEGSMSPDDATRILSAGASEAVAKEIARGVTWGMVSANKAQKLVQALNQTPPASGAAPGAASAGGAHSPR